ncbi:MAG TPA: helix-turn-helix domain-containing protein [Candidatus Cybelea sp.]|nr:helix-turn-helix domain-containing protein [Candidatus Cybelea sp.]
MENNARSTEPLDFGALLRHHRLDAGLSQEALAELARLSPNGISALERGYRRSPQRETLALLAGALALTAEQRNAFEAAAARPSNPRQRERTSVTQGPWLAAAAPLPLALSTFVGRETELLEISALVRERQLVTITGAGGVGKTQTALRSADAVRESVQAPVYFAGLAPIDDPALVATIIAAALDVHETPNHTLLETAIAYLRNRDALLVLDNCEHLLPEVIRVIESLLSACPRLRILATSREPLRSAGEYAYRLPSLSVESSMILFVDRARAVDHRFALTAEGATIVTDLCRRLDGIPLAIELAAARVNVLPLKALSERLGNRFALLTGSDRTAVPRQQTLRAAIDWSYKLLSEPEQKLFERLSVFAAGCTIETAVAVCSDDGTSEDDVLDLISSLVDKSLLTAQREGRAPRLRLLESFREYASERLAARGERQRFAHRHALAYLDLAHRLDRAFDYDADEVWRDMGAEEIDDWRAAMRWALTDRNDVLLGQRIVSALTPLWTFFVPVEGQRWLRAATECADANTPSDILAALSLAQAANAWQHRDYGLQIKGADDAIARSRALGDGLGVAWAQAIAGYGYASLGRFAESKALAEEALAGGRRLGNPRLTAYALRCLGYFSSIEGDIGAARDFVEQACRIYEAMCAKFSWWAAMNDLAYFEFRAGNVERACALMEESAAFGRAHKITRFMSVVLSNTAKYLMAVGRYDEAAEKALECLESAREQSIDAETAWALQQLAAIALMQPRAERTGVLDVEIEAARIVGFVDARLVEIGSGQTIITRDERERIMERLRGALPPERLAELLAAGAGMTEDEAVAAAHRCNGLAS